MGIELLSLFIPVIAIFFMAIFFKNHVVWWEYGLLILVPLIFILILHKIFVINITSDVKYKDGYIVRLEYYEKWDEYISRTCSRTVSCGKNCTRTVYYDCSYVENHPERFYAIDNTKYEYQISKSEYIKYKNQFKTKETFKELNRNYHSIDGNMFYVLFDNDLNKLLSFTRTERYENRTQASKNLFKFEKINEDDVKKYKLFDYPEIINNRQISILGKNVTNEELNKIDIINSVIGSKKNLKVFILYFKNANTDIVFKQKSYWNGGNNNEFIICISEDNKGNLQWVRTFSWMTTPKLEKVFESEFRDKNKITNIDIYNSLLKNIDKNWEYNNFKQFEYIQVEITKTQLTTLYFIILFITIGISYWVYVNEFENEKRFQSDYSRWKRF